MFGNSVTEKDKFTDGTYGYTVAVDLTPWNARTISSVLASDDGTVSDPIVGSTDLTVLLKYVNQSDCPDLAYNVGSDILTIFFKASVYPYQSTTKYLATGYRSALPVASLSDFPDIKNSNLELFCLLSVQKAATILNKKIPQNIQDRIVFLKAQLKEIQ